MYMFQLQCCGVLNIKDWAGMTEQEFDGDQNSTIFVPQSCCRSFIYETTTCEGYFTDGCLNRMNFIISQSAMIIATGATTVAFVQV